MMVSRDELPPALRVEKLVMKQKITIRGDDRNTIEGIVVLMHKCRMMGMTATLPELILLY